MVPTGSGQPSAPTLDAQGLLRTHGTRLSVERPCMGESVEPPLDPQ